MEFSGARAPFQVARLRTLDRPKQSMTVITAIAITKGETSSATSQLQLPSGSSALTQMQTASRELVVAAQAALFTVRKRK